MQRFSVILTLLLFLPQTALFSSNPSLEEISDRKYLPKVLEWIQNSRESIDVSMYQILLASDDPAHPVAQILKALAGASARGVKVRVLLNRHLDYTAGESVPLARSLAAYEFMTAKGIEVVFAHSSRRLHDKVIVIDGRFVVEGSMNWTRTALLSNWESATVIDSPEYAAEKLKRIRGIPVAVEKTLDSLGDEGELIQIPAELLTDEKYFPDMLEDKDERIFEFYLWLVKEHPLTPPLSPSGRGQAARRTSLARGRGEGITVPDPALFRIFRLDPQKSQKDKRREAVRLLKKLEKQGLIELKIPSAGADVEIGLPPHPAPLPIAFTLPLTYFQFGLPARLSFAAEFFYLLSRLEMSRSPSPPWWWRSEEYLSQVYHVHHTTLAAGMLELQRENILEIVRDDAPAGRPHSERLVNRYRVNRLIDPADLDKQMKALENKFGELSFRQARGYADKIDEPNDPLALATILKWMSLYPAGKLAAAFDQVSRYERNNPRRSLYYLRGMLEKSAV